ncbi:MAG: DEAD/DEAH box helicase family protein [Chloroflexi bacterium]|nr:DEAD/DEAH box helicase family protein [Chloroflexota bacterium]
MGRIYVAVDLETTGLDPEKDTILELGAVRFRDGEILETFSQVVNPNRPVSRFIQQLTGISQAEAEAAPYLSSVASAFRRFIGDHPLVGHNIAFDAAFLRSHNLYRLNPLIDTWELAVILLWGLPSYKLGRVAEHLGIDLVDAHRAFADAEATMYVFEALRQRAEAMPLPALQSINRIAAHSDWPLQAVFADAEAAAARHWSQRAKTEKRKDFGPLFERQEVLEPVDHPQPLDVDELAALLEPGGRFSQIISAYEYRPTQVEMLRSVAEAFNHSDHVMIEAGTGTGKSVAYLIPALAWAVQNQQRVVVSSNTINLQEQLFHKDLPDLRHTLPFDFKVAVLKGRNNYLCPRRLRHMLQRPDLSPVEISVLARILAWLPHTETGDQSEITLTNAQERAVWQRVCSDSNTCSPARCVENTDQPDFFYLARSRAESAHLIIINHALLLADIATENRVIPPYQHLIIDEAHHLEKATTQALTVTIDHASFVMRLRELAPSSSEQQTTGLLAEAATAVRNSKCPTDKAEDFVSITRVLAERIPMLDMRMFDFFDAIDRFLAQHMGRQYDNTDYDLRLRITSKERVQPAWVNVELLGDNLLLELKSFNENIERLNDALADFSNYLTQDVEDLSADLQALRRDLLEVQTLCAGIAFDPQPNTIYWVRRSNRTGALSLNSAPLHVGRLIEQHIFMPKDTVILTSATLRTANSFDYLRDRLGAADAKEQALDSPFNYRAAALVYIPSDMPEPNQKTFQSKVEEAILALSLATQGRLLALFTSYAQLQRTAEALRPLLEEHQFNLLVQGTGGSRQQILADFRQSERAVLMGTRSFWEGVDVQGEALSALVIVKLPFSVPTDPIVSARSETFDSPFFHYQVPEAILNLRQGFGRLIRSQNDRGICVILDKRLISKRYGSLFLESLPDCTIQRAPLANLPGAAQRWLQGERPQELQDTFNGYENYMPEPPPPDSWG